MKYSLLTTFLIIYSFCNAQNGKHTIPIGDSTYPIPSYAGATLYNHFKTTERKKDTVKVICQVVDTTHEYMPPYNMPDSISLVGEGGSIESIRYWKNGIAKKPIDIGMKSPLDSYFKVLYAVREEHTTGEDFDSGMTPRELWGKWWQYILYLDTDKKPLTKNIIVWISKEIK